MSHRMEGLMDDETREALAMTKDELLALLDAGKPAKLARKPRADVAITAKRVMDAVIERTEDVESERHEGGTFGGRYFMRLPSVPQPVGT